MDITDLEGSMWYQMYLGLLIMLNWARQVKQRDPAVQKLSDGLHLEADKVSLSA